MRRGEIWFGGCACTFLALLITMIVLLAMTVNREVTQTEFVVPYNQYTCEFGSVLEQGRHTTEVGVEFLSFPRVLKDLNVQTVTCLTSDKVEINLNMKIQYRLGKQCLTDVILEQFSSRKKHAKFLKTVAKSSILTSCLDYEAEQFYSLRSEVDSHIFNGLQNDINTNGFCATVEFFQLNDIVLPDKLIETIIQKQSLQQEIITADNDRENQIITANTKLIAVEQSSQVILIEANNTASITYDAARQTEEAIVNSWYNRAVAYKQVVTSLNLNEKEFADYLGAQLALLASKAVSN